MKERCPSVCSIFRGFIMFSSVVLIVLPLVVCLLNSFRSTSDLLHGFIRIPKEISFENYQYMIERRGILRHLCNSIGITAIGTFISAVINPYIAYIIAINWERVQYRATYFMMSACMFIPTKIVLFPLIKIYYKLGLMNILGLIVYYAVFMVPETVFMLVPYFKFFKGELREAAMMDGCSTLRFYKRIFFPVCKPFILTVMILNAVWIWNDFFIPLMILNKTPAMWTLPICIYNYLGKNGIHMGYSLASCQIALFPIIIFYTLFHKKIIEGFVS